MAIKFPSIAIIYTKPTPSETVMICDGCQEGDWYIEKGRVRYCTKCGRRLRKATQKEKEAAIQTLKPIYRPKTNR